MPKKDSPAWSTVARSGKTGWLTGLRSAADHPDSGGFTHRGGRSSPRPGTQLEAGYGGGTRLGAALAPHRLAARGTLAVPGLLLPD